MKTKKLFTMKMILLNWYTSNMVWCVEDPGKYWDVPIKGSKGTVVANGGKNFILKLACLPLFGNTWNSKNG